MKYSGKISKPFLILFDNICLSAQISKKHANFIINLGNASAIDIEKLIEYVRERVFDLKNIMLETEIKFIGDNYAPK